MGKRKGPQDPASFGFKFRHFVRSLPQAYTHEDLSALAKIQRPTLTKWANEGDSAKLPEHDWVIRLVRAVKAPDVLADWLRNGKPNPMPVSAGASVATSYPDPLRDVIAGNFAELDCLAWAAPSEWTTKGNRGTKIRIPLSLNRQDAIGLPIENLDESLKNLAEQGHILLAYEVSRTPTAGDLVIAKKKDRLIARVLRSGANGYELDFVGKQSPVPAAGWEIAYMPVAVIKHVEPGRLNIDFRPSGFQF